MKPMRDIPNQAGYLPTVFLRSGRSVKTKVRRSNATGLHTLIGMGRVWSDCAGWEPRRLKRNDKKANSE